MPTSSLRDLITRYARWQESGGVRQSIMISDRRGSAVSSDDNDMDIANEGEVIAWDFDTSLSDIAISSPPEEKTPLSLGNLGNLGYLDDSSSTFDTLLSRPSYGQSTLSSTTTSSSTLPLNIQHSAATEHPLEQLFNDGTVRSATAPPALRSRKDTMPSRPVSPLPPLSVSNTQPSSPDSEYRPGTALGMTAFDLRLPDIAPIAPIQIEIPTTEDTLRKDAPGVRSRSATVTRPGRSDSAGSTGFPSRVPRHNPTEPMPQSPPRTIRAASPKPQPPLPTLSNAPKAQPMPMSPPKPAPSVPLNPPKSPPKAHHIPSKSVPNNASLSPATLSAITALQDNVPTKPRSSDLKPPRPANLILNVSPYNCLI
jgi:hypothetical protein